jgi:hypothetical protein
VLDDSCLLVLLNCCYGLQQTSATTHILCEPAVQAAAANAKKLSREEIKAMRRANDPNFKERESQCRRLLFTVFQSC